LPQGDEVERGPDNATWRETVDAPPAELAPSDPGADPQAEIGPRIGRFVPIECIGKGGMGVVWSAYDPELDRKVAIKLIAGDVHGPGTKGELAATRMLREARALAGTYRRAYFDALALGIDTARERLETLRRAADPAPLTEAREEARKWSPALRRLAEEVAG
jgi:hypothetical protein